MLQVRGLGKVYPGRPQPALDRVSLDVHDGEVLGLVGLNGAGKTSLIRICAGVIRPSAGKVLAQGFDIVSEKADASSFIGWVPEFPNFEPNARALDQLCYYAGFYGETGAKARSHGERLLREVGLPGLGNTRLRAFSQGMKKRFSLAAALLGDPEVLLFDEILNGLDPEGVVAVRNRMLDLRDRGKAVLLSSHILLEVEKACDRIAIIHQGKLRATLSHSDLTASTQNVLRLTIANLDENGLTFLQHFGDLEREGNTVWVWEPSRPVQEINAELVRLGYHVTGLSFEHESLEEVFFRIIHPGTPDGRPASGGAAS